MAAKPHLSPKEILNDLRREHPTLDWDVIDENALETEKKRVQLGAYIQESSKCPELILADVLVDQLIKVGDREFSVHEVYTVIPENSHYYIPENSRSYSLAVWDDLKRRWCLRTKSTVEPGARVPGSADKVGGIAMED